MGPKTTNFSYSPPIFIHPILSTLVYKTTTDYCSPPHERLRDKLCLHIGQYKSSLLMSPSLAFSVPFTVIPRTRRDEKIKNIKQPKLALSKLWRSSLPWSRKSKSLPRAIPKYPAKGYSLSCYKVPAFAMRIFASNFQGDTSHPESPSCFRCCT